MNVRREEIDRDMDRQMQMIETDTDRARVLW